MPDGFAERGVVHPPEVRAVRERSPELPHETSTQPAEQLVERLVVVVHAVRACPHLVPRSIRPAEVVTERILMRVVLADRAVGVVAAAFVAAGAAVEVLALFPAVPAATQQGQRLRQGFGNDGPRQGRTDGLAVARVGDLEPASIREPGEPVRALAALPDGRERRRPRQRAEPGPRLSARAAEVAARVMIEATAGGRGEEREERRRTGGC